MRILCRHGHFAFYPKTAEDIARFCSYYKIKLVRDGEYYTFPFLKEAPRYSLQGKPYLELPALVTVEGREPWDVLKENGFVYHLLGGVLIPKAAVVIAVNPPRLGYTYLGETPLLQPGSRDKTGQQILSYDAEFFPDTFKTLIREFSYE